MTETQEKLDAIRAFRSSKIEAIAKLQNEKAALEKELTTLAVEETTLRRKIREETQEQSKQEKLAQLAKIHQSYIDIQAQIHSIEELIARWKETGAKEYQLEGASAAAAAQGFILADQMGLGKSFQSIIALDMISNLSSESKVVMNLRNARTGLPPVMDEINYGQSALYICPKTLIGNVVREFHLWDKGRMVFVLDSTNWLFLLKSIETMFQNSKQNYVVVTNYEVWRRNKDIAAKLTQMRFGTLIVDESHNLKTVKSVNFRTIKEISSTIPFRILMTGTPILNRPDDIFTSMNLISPSIFPTQHSFNNAFCYQKYINGRVQWVFRPGGTQALFRVAGNVLLKRTKMDVGIELPPLTVIPHDLEVEDTIYTEQWGAYKEMRDVGMTMLDSEEAISATVLIALLTRLRQICLLPYAVMNHNGTRLQIQQSQKLDYVYELIEEITRHKQNNPDGERTVLFSQFTEPLKWVQKALEERGYRTVLMIGATPEDVREQVIKDLDARTVEDGGYYDIVLCNYKVGGVGLNFTDATQLIMLDSEWNLGKQDQALGRLHRVGQTKPVTVHKILVAGTVDKWMESLIETKGAMLEGFESDLTAFEELKKGLLDEFKKDEGGNEK